MATRDTLYRKFGEAVEAAQLLETELGAWLANHYGKVEHLFPSPPPRDGADFFKHVNRERLFKLLTTVYDSSVVNQKTERIMLDALDDRNLLVHTYFAHNKTNIATEHGRTALLIDLEKTSRTLAAAYEFALLMSEGMLPVKS